MVNLLRGVAIVTARLAITCSVLTLLQVSGTPAAAATEINSVSMPGSTHRYAFIEQSMDWDNAAALAKTFMSGGMPGHLATVQSVQEHDFIAALAPLGGWLGGEAVASGWTWSQSQPGGTDRLCAPDEVCPEYSFAMWAPGQSSSGSAVSSALLLGQAEKESDHIGGTVSEYSDLTLSAPSRAVFTSVRFASYGTPNGYSQGWCHSGVSSERVAAAFLGRESGTIGANNGVFGDPCVGTYKRLHVLLGFGGSRWFAAAKSQEHGFIVEFEPNSDSGNLVTKWSFNQPGLYNFAAPRRGWFRLQALGGGGGGGRRDWGWNSGGGGGGGAYAGLEVFLDAGEPLLVRVGHGGLGAPGPCCSSFTDALAGEASTFLLNGSALLVAGGGGGGGGSGSTDFSNPPEAPGGSAGIPSFPQSVAVVRERVGHAGGAGGESDAVGGDHHNGGDGGAAGNSEGDGAQGSAGGWARCFAPIEAAPGDMPSGIGGWGGVGPIIELSGYGMPKSRCPRFDEIVNEDQRRTMSYGAGAGGTKGSSNAVGAGGFARITLISATPDAPRDATAVAGDGAVEVHWTFAATAALSEPSSFVVTALPGGAQCEASAAQRTCTVTGLRNRSRYSFSVKARNSSGDSPLAQTEQAVPLAPGLQAWLANPIVLPGDDATLTVGNATARSTITVKSTIPGLSLATDSRGLGTVAVRIPRAGVTKFVVRVGSRQATAQAFAPQIVGPSTRIRWGAQVRISMKYLPSGASVKFSFGGAESVATSDVKGVASAVFPARIRGQVNYGASVEGLQVGMGTATVS